MLISASALLVLLFFWAVLGYFQQSLRLNNSVQISSAPSAVQPFGGGYQGGVAYDYTAPPRDSYGYEESASYGKGGAAGGMPIMPPVPNEAPTGDMKIIRSAHLTLLVADTDAAIDAITAVRLRENGQAGNAQFTENAAGVRQGTMTIWVPQDRFDSALAEIKKIAIRVESENVTATDVSNRYADLSAQLRNWEAAERQYLEIMGRAGKIPEVMEVANALVNARQYIESIKGQLNALDQQVALASITITLIPEASPRAEANEWRPGIVFKEAFARAIEELQGFTNMLIAAAVRLPILILWIAFYGLILWAVVAVGRKVYMKLSGRSNLLPPF